MALFVAKQAVENLQAHTHQHSTNPRCHVRSSRMSLSGLVLAGIFTVLILKRRLYLHHWQGMMLIVVGCFIVGLSSVLDEAAYDPHRRHYPPYEPPYGPPPDPYDDFASTTTTAVTSSNTLRSILDIHDNGVNCSTARSAGEFEATAQGAMAIVEWLRRAFGVLFMGLSWDGRYREPTQCRSGARPLLGNLCVMAAQVLLLFFS